MYKLPKNSEQGKKGSAPLVDEGLAYMYISSNSPHEGWTMSNISIKDHDSIPGRILSPIYAQRSNKELFRMFYNDEHPDGNTSFTMGHTKGVLAFTESSGFWLIHSVPKYPPPIEMHYDYPHTGQMYGQTFLCISLTTKTVADEIGLQMMVNHPFIYSAFVPTWVDKKYQQLTMAAMGKHLRKPPYMKISAFKSMKGLTFTSFAKSAKFGQDLYADLVAPSLKTDLIVESWPNGPGKMTSRCTGHYKVMNINSIDFHMKPDDVSFASHKDHAKWAISLTKPIKAMYVCIGDINRMETQKKRGGGTVCFHDKFAWKAFFTITNSVEACPKF